MIVKKTNIVYIILPIEKLIFSIKKLHIFKKRKTRIFLRQQKHDGHERQT